jgi:hypothetical protein
MGVCGLRPGHNPHTRPPEDGNLMAKHVGENLERINNKKILEYLLVFLQTILQDAWFNHQDNLSNVRVISSAQSCDQSSNY